MTLSDDSPVPDYPGEADDSPVPDYPGLLRLDGRGFIVVGAGQGMGRQTSHALASVGARVFCIDKEPDLAKAVADEVGGVPFVADVRRREEVEGAVAEAGRELGGLDGLVDIVGGGHQKPLFDITDDDWDHIFARNLRQAFYFAQIAGQAMVSGSGGVMVFIATVSVLTGAPQHADYGAAKAGLVSLVRSTAVELGPAPGAGERGGTRPDAETTAYRHHQRRGSGSVGGKRSPRAATRCRPQGGCWGASRYRRGRPVLGLGPLQLDHRPGSGRRRRRRAEVSLSDPLSGVAGYIEEA